MFDRGVPMFDRGVPVFDREVPSRCKGLVVGRARADMKRAGYGRLAGAAQAPSFHGGAPECTGAAHASRRPRGGAWGGVLIGVWRHFQPAARPPRE